ncbi:MAG TPA: ribosome-associated translation inhibitor RaiA [Anaerolineales bacterium]|nr:ribosome-associated translation inhibitor RaiA [Anaerolineales bacterium]
MSEVSIHSRNMEVSDRLNDYVTKKAGRLDRYLPGIDEARVDLAFVKTARSVNDRQVAQITVRGKKFVLRAEERAEDIFAAFDMALDKMQRQMERYKGKQLRSRTRGDGKTLGEMIAEEEAPEPAAESDAPVIARRKKFALTPMDEIEAIEHMQLLGHEDFFIFYNFNTESVNVIYRRRDGSYGLIEPELG